MKALRIYSTTNYEIDLLFIVSDMDANDARRALQEGYDRYWSDGPDETIGKYLEHYLDSRGLYCCFYSVGDFYPDDYEAIERDDVPLWKDFICRKAQECGRLFVLAN